MTYTYCEAAMWHIMMPAAFQYLSETNSDWDIPALKRRSKQIYRQIVSRTPDTGSMIKNPLRVCMTGGMLWLSVFEAAEGHMSEECFEGMVNASMKTPLVQKSYRSKAKIAFTLKAQKKAYSVRGADRCRRESLPVGRGDYPGEGCRGIHHSLSPMRPVRFRVSRGPSPPGSLYVCVGYYVYRLDGWCASPHQDIGCWRRLLRLLHLQEKFQMGYRT